MCRKGLIMEESIHTKKSDAELSLWNRKQLNLKGIEDVVSFDELAVYLVTKDGNLIVEGTELHITALDVAEGIMTIEGHIRSMVYSDKETAIKGSFFSKMFK